MSNVIIVGAGASGLMAAALISEYGSKVTVIEKNEKPGKKLYITGKGRCNLTNACDRDGIMDSIVTNRRFFYSAFSAFNNYDVMDFFEIHGVKLKVERGMRVFPESDKSIDIINCLEKVCKQNNVEFLYRTRVTEIFFDDKLNKDCSGDSRHSNCDSTNVTDYGFIGVKTDSGKMLVCDKIIVATGGLSYPSTGSTGDGYFFAEKIGHKVTKRYPSLVSLKIKEEFCSELSGLSLKNVRVSVNKDDKELYSGFGEMLFTHTGVSGPLILSCSAEAGISCEGSILSIDLKPALDNKTLDERLIRELMVDSNKQLKSVIRTLLPASMVSVLLNKAKVDGTKKASSVTKEERYRIVTCLKKFSMTVTGLGGFNEAVITKGGIDVKEINPATMESKLCKDIYFIGEVLDLDALTGGFNLQIAWSTAAAAARSVVE